MSGSLYPIDPSIFARLGQGAPEVQSDHTGQIARVQQIAKSGLDYRKNLLALDAEQAQGNALLNATDRKTGVTDYAKARAAMAADPRAALGAAAAFHDQNVSRSDDIVNQDAHLAFQQHASRAAADGMGRLINDPSNANVQGYAAFMSRLTPEAAPQIATIAQQVTALPTIPQRKEALKAAFTAHMGQEASNQVFGTPTSVDDGSTIQTGTQASGMDGGAFTPAAGVTKTMSPEARGTYHTVPVMGPNGPENRQMTNDDIKHANSDGGFSGRRVDVTGAGAPPSTSIPVGAESQANTGLGVRNALNAGQADVTNNETTLRNLDGLLSRVPKDARSRKLSEVLNNLDKFGISPDPAYATLAQEIDKASATTRQQMLEGGGGPHTNAGLAELSHITPSLEMTPTAARALVNEQLTGALYNRGRAKLANSVSDPTKVLSSLADYDANFEPRFATIQRLGREEGTEYARTHIGNQAQYEQSLYRMAKAQQDKGYDYGLPDGVMKTIIGRYEAAHAGR